ncbi:hypothetical protein Tco_1551763 [Tanacetum coccineum]
MEDDKESDEHEEVEVDDEVELIVKHDIAIDAIPLATKPPMIVEYKLLKKGIMTLWKLVKTKHGDIRPVNMKECCGVI